MPRKFLTAEWRKLIMANYAVDPKILKPYLPAHTALDLWNNTCYISLVGFMFCNTKVLGLSIPFHRHFEEVNLRFYVKYKDDNEWKRGVVFIKEIVPKAAITLVANTLYKEHYTTLPMRHQWTDFPDHKEVTYEWKYHKEWNQFSVKTEKMPKPLVEGSEAEFITEHYWGYTKLAKDRTSEYQVEHPSWDVYDVTHHTIKCTAHSLYGNEFGEAMEETPKSVFMAEGSEIVVRKGQVISG
ncbi:MAG: DUF2071 domain-containing protein [Bacteroidota bacterium]